MSPSDGSIFRKLVVLPKRGLGRLVECVLLLWALLADPDVPTWAKAIVAVALGYLVCPFDGVPDLLPGGLVDDAALLLSTLARLSGFVTAETRRRAREKREALGL